MKVSSIRKGVVLAIAAGAFGLGCELVVDFDRTRIPVEQNDGAPGADSSIDASFDTSQPTQGMMNDPVQPRLGSSALRKPERHSKRRQSGRKTHRSRERSAMRLGTARLRRNRPPTP